MAFESKDTVFCQKKTLNVCGNLVDLSTPMVMGILNVTDDSFFDGGRYLEETAILSKVEKMLEDGAGIIDVGGYSSRPGADNISVSTEKERVTNAVKLIKRKFPKAFISVDTFRAEVAEAAVIEGAGIINDISAGNLDQNMLSTVAKLNVPYILMHMKGTPQTMVELAQYDNLQKEILLFFSEKINALKALGIKDIIIDPGFGFAKRIDQNFQLLNSLDIFKFLELPIMVGVSRKSMVYKTLQVTPEQALNGTTVLNTVALLKGASILRVHDVKEAVEAVKLIEKLK